MDRATTETRQNYDRNDNRISRRVSVAFLSWFCRCSSILDSFSDYIWNKFLTSGPDSSPGTGLTSGQDLFISGLGTNDVFNLVTKMHAQSGITNVADVYNLSKYNSRIMAAFLPEYENVEL